MTHERFDDHRDVAVLLLRGADDLPRDRGQMCGNPAEDFAIEELEELGTTLVHQTLSEVTRLPLFKTSGSGSLG